MPPLHPLVLKLTQDGAPLSGASVSLFNESESSWTVGGTTDASGNAVLMTHGKYPGVPAGKYNVCVFKVETVPKADPAKPKENDPALSEYNPPRPDEYDLVDGKLKSPATTTLTLEAGPGKKNVTLDAGKPIRILINNTDGA